MAFKETFLQLNNCVGRVHFSLKWGDLLIEGMSVTFPEHSGKPSLTTAW